MDGVGVETEIRMSTPFGYQLRGSIGWRDLLPIQFMFVSYETNIRKFCYFDVHNTNKLVLPY